MPIVQEIDNTDALRLLNLEESAYLDFKDADILPAKLSRAISAFANTDGGEIFIGISEKNAQFSWYGFKNQEAANPIFQVLTSIDPSAQSHAANFIKCNEQTGLVLQLTIYKSREVVFATDGKPYIRRNAQSLPVNDTEGLKRLELDKGIISYEDQTVNIEIENVTNSETILSFILDVIPSAEPEAWLKKQNLLHNGKPKVSSVLLFHDEPQAALPKRSAIKIFRYKTCDTEGTRDALVFDPITIEGCASKLIKDAVLQTKKIIEEISILSSEGLEKVFYPDEALHEIITNAVLHRDYSIAADVQVRIFDNRVEIISPGSLPGHITLKNILDEQSARNPQLVRIINKFPNPPNKDVGEGLNTAFEAMKKHRLKEPVIAVKNNSVFVTIRHESLASPHDIVMQYLEHNEDITNRKARELTAISSENSMKNVFYDLKDKGLIEPVPLKKGKSFSWRKKLKDEEKEVTIARDLFEYADNC